MPKAVDYSTPEPDAAFQKLEARHIAAAAKTFRRYEVVEAPPGDDDGERHARQMHNEELYERAAGKLYSVEKAAMGLHATTGAHYDVLTRMLRRSRRADSEPWEDTCLRELLPHILEVADRLRLDPLSRRQWSDRGAVQVEDLAGCAKAGEHHKRVG